MNHPLSTKLAAVAVVGALAMAGGGVARAATTATAATSLPSTGSIRLFATDNGSARGSILFTGEVGDYGTAVSVDRSGAPSPDGVAVEVHLRKGSFNLDVRPLNKASESDHFHADRATCSGWVATTAVLPILRGTGRYKGIHGTVRVLDTYAVIAPRIANGPQKGRCSRNGRPSSQFESITGVGQVTLP